MKAVVTGAHGFIGSHLCQSLLTLGYEVKTVPREMLGNMFELQAYMEMERPDEIYHLAAYGNHSTQTDCFASYHVNVFLLLNLLTATRDLPYRSLIVFGSSSEYGTHTKPLDEYTTPFPTTFYASSKLASTFLATTFARVHHKPIAVVRPFSVYGPGEAGFRFIPTIIRSLKYGEHFTLDPHPVHDWIYIDDFLRGLFTVRDHIDHLDGRWVNIGTEQQTSNIEVVHLLEHIADEKALYAVSLHLRPYDSACWKADTTLLRSYGWTPRISLEEGLRRTYEHTL